MLEPEICARISIGRHRVRQVWSAVVFCQGHFAAGAAMAFISVFIYQESQQNSVDITANERTWVVSSFPVGMVLGNLLSISLTPHLGYKKMALMSAVGSSLSWLGVALAHNFYLLLASRVGSGVFLGASDGAARAYISETADRDLRGALGMLPNLMIAANMMCFFALSAHMNWRIAVFILAIPPYLLQFFATLALPEASKWLLAHGNRVEEAKKSLSYFRNGDDADLDMELRQVSLSLQSSASDQDATNISTIGRIKMLISHSSKRRPFLLLVVQLALSVYNPGEAISNFSTLIFSRVDMAVSPYYASVCVGGVRIVGFIMSAWLIERLGRIRLLQAASALQMIGGVLVGWFFYQQKVHPEKPLGAWLVLCGCGLIYFAYGVGIVPVTWVLFSELLPNIVRAVSVNILLTLFGLIMFSFVHMYTYAEETFGTSVVFWTLSLVNFIQILFAHSMLPETKGLTLEEIQHKYFDEKPRIEKQEAYYNKAYTA